MNRILLVEDDCDLANITGFYLKRAGYEVDIAASCAEATDLINRVEYQVVLLDSVLPDGKNLRLIVSGRRVLPLDRNMWEEDMGSRS